MADAIRTRCKFRVVGVEDTDYEIENKRVYEDENPELFEQLGEPTTTEYHVPKPNETRKFRVQHSGRYCQNVRLAASYDTANSEDVSFAEATPSGEVKIYVSNPAVIGTFKPGKNYYLDLIPCE